MMYFTEGSTRLIKNGPFNCPDNGSRKKYTMSYHDIIILTKKIIVGIVVAVIPFLIFFIGLRIVQHF